MTTRQAGPAPRSVGRAIAAKRFCVLATSSPRTGAHAVGVLYAAVDGVLYIATLDDSRKARNIRDNPRVGVCIPARRYPLAPPFVVQFQATASVLSPNHPTITGLLQGRRLRKITSHGELDEPRTCFLELTPDRKVSTYGIGVPLSALVRDPLRASRTFELQGPVA